MLWKHFGAPHETGHGASISPAWRRLGVWTIVAFMAAWVGAAPCATGRGQAAAFGEVPSGRYAVTSASQCAGPGTRAVPNGTHGSIRVLSGTGTFSAVSPPIWSESWPERPHKAIAASPGEPLNGTIELDVVNHGPDSAIAPLIWTPSWGDPASSWRLIADWVRPGQWTYKAQIGAIAPQTPGTYHILFAFNLETNGASVASATNWARGQAIWGDGNDIAQFNEQQISEAQRFGCTTDSWLMESGPQLVYVPADAITVYVGPASLAPSSGFTTVVRVPANVPWTRTRVPLEKADEVTISAAGTIRTNLAGATAAPGGTRPDCSVAGPVQIPFVAPQLPCWSLLGRVGPSGDPFEVGDRIIFRAATRGQLYLGVNDNFFGDNSGSWTVTITVGRSAGLRNSRVY